MELLTQLPDYICLYKKNGKWYAQEVIEDQSLFGTYSLDTFQNRGYKTLERLLLKLKELDFI